MKKKMVVGLITIGILILLAAGVKVLIWNLYTEPVRKDKERNAGEVVYMENGERIIYKEGTVCYAQGELVVFNNSNRPRTFKVIVNQPAGYFSGDKFVKTKDVELDIDNVELSNIEKGSGMVNADQTVTIGPFSKIQLSIDSHYNGPEELYTQRCAPDISFELVK